MTAPWDPLNSSENIDLEIISASIKREIKNILKSYVGTFDPFNELIQNALDAVDKRGLSDPSFTQKLWLTINLQENSFTLVDNGIGFSDVEFKSFLAPNISFKDGKNSRGNKGVGATYIAYGFNHLELGTKHPDFSFFGEIKNGREWIEDFKGISPRPVVKEAQNTSELFDSIDRGSIFKLTFGGYQTRPKDLSWFQASTVEQWLYLLLIKTPLGCVDLLGKIVSKTSFELTVINAKGEKSSVIETAGYIYPHSRIGASIDLREILQFQAKQVQAGRDATKYPAKFTRLNGLYEFFSKDEVKLLRTTKLGDAEKTLIDEYNVSAYGYFAYSTSLWDELNDNVAKLRKGYRVLRGGIQLANNYMIQGDVFPIPLTSNIGYQNQTHVLVHFENADPDLGRKGFQPELKELAESIGLGIVNEFKAWKTLLRTDSGARPDIGREIALHEWIKHQEEFEQSHPLTINNPHFFKPVNEISISSEPQVEQDVIVLFNQLLAGGVIRGIKLLSTSQYNQYDSLYKFAVNPPETNHIFDKTLNPLGVESINIPIGTVTQPKVLEYKYNLNGLIAEFENGDKKEKEVSLAVAWEIGDQWKKHYEAVSLLDLQNLHQRPFHGITHIFQTPTSSFYAIILKELIAYLNNVDGVQAHHIAAYSTETV